MLNPLEHPICLAEPKLINIESAWVGHIPFAMFIIDLLRPTVLVELGTHRGDSYAAFCQAVQALKIGMRCFAVDTWAGDDHAGHYGVEILKELRAHHDPLYSDFSTLKQSTFDEALVDFEDGSIDLLHIDGHHTYEAVKHDFDTWLPKMSPKAIVLFHDTVVREGDFGVWKLWDELSACYPHFAFDHCNGLGVLGVGTELPGAVRELLNSTEEEQVDIRNFFYVLGHRLTVQNDCVRLLAEKDRQLTDKDRQIEALYNSMSWRVTAPIRALASIVKK